MTAEITHIWYSRRQQPPADFDSCSSVPASFLDPCFFSHLLFYPVTSMHCFFLHRQLEKKLIQETFELQTYIRNLSSTQNLKITLRSFLVTLMWCVQGLSLKHTIAGFAVYLYIFLWISLWSDGNPQFFFLEFECLLLVSSVCDVIDSEYKPGGF